MDDRLNIKKLIFGEILMFEAIFQSKGIRIINKRMFSQLMRILFYIFMTQNMNEGEVKEVIKSNEKQEDRLRIEARAEMFQQNRVESKVQTKEKQEEEVEITIGINKSYIVDLRYRTEIEEFLRASPEVQNLRLFVEAIYEEDAIRNHYGVIGIRKILSISDNPSIQQVIDTGIVPRLMELTKDTKFPQMQVEAVWSLVNIASGTGQQCQHIINLGVIPLFIELLRHRSRVAQKSIWAIGNIASDSAFKTIITSCCWALSNLCRGKPLPMYEKISAAIPVLCQAVGKGELENKQIIASCCWAIHNHLKTDKQYNQRIEIVLKSGLIPYLLRTVKEKANFAILLPSIHILRCVAAGTTDQVTYLIQQGILQSFVKSDILSHCRKVIRKLVCWVLFSITAGNASQVEAVIRQEALVKKISQLFNNDADDIKYLICFVLSNMAHAGDPVTVYNFYISIDIITPFMILLQEKQKTDQIIKCLLTILCLCEKVVGVNSQLALNLRNHERIFQFMEMLSLHESDLTFDNVIILQRYLQIPAQ